MASDVQFEFRDSRGLLRLALPGEAELLAMAEHEAEVRLLFEEPCDECGAALTYGMCHSCDQDLWDNDEYGSMGDTDGISFFASTGPDDWSFNHPVWWRTSDTCTGESCACGRITLLEALSEMNAGEAQAAIDAHSEVLTAAWDHYWACHSSMVGDKGELGAVCVGCIVSGHIHMAALADEAEDLACELGEAVAAYHSQITLGRPRYAIEDLTRASSEEAGLKDASWSPRGEALADDEPLFDDTEK